MSQEETQLLINEPDPQSLLYNSNNNNNNDEATSRISSFMGSIISTIETKVNNSLCPEPKGKDLLKDKTDEFYQEVYDYFKRKGFGCIILERICHLITIAFVICFSVFLFGCIDYSIINEKTRLSQVIVDQCVYKLDWKIKSLISVFIIMWLYLFIKYIFEFLRLRKIHYFYKYKLKIKDVDVQSISWEAIMEKIIKLYNEENQSKKKEDELDAMKIVNIIMRKENYFIALINEQRIKFNIPFFENKQLFTDMLNWNVQLCLNNFIFDRNGLVKKYFLLNNNRKRLSKSLSQRFILLGIFNLILLPFLLIFTVFYSFYRYSEEIYNNPGSIMKKSYSLLARWKFREFNELPHVFEKRLNRSYDNAMIYLNQSPNFKISIIFRLIAFISGSVVIVLSILTLLDQEFFNKFEITPGGSVLFYIGIFTSILATSKGMIVEDIKEYDPNILMEKIALETHYYPQKWKEENYSNEVRNEFSSYFDKKIFMVFRNIFGIILTPFILMISLPNYSDDIVDFVQQYSVNIPSVGYICSYANFDFRNYGNPDYGYKAEEDQEDENKNEIHIQNNNNKIKNKKEGKKYSNNGKMEMSFLGFQDCYKSWKPKKETGGLEYSKIIENYKLNNYLMPSFQKVKLTSSSKGKESEINLPNQLNSVMYSSSIILSAMENMDQNNINSSCINFAVLNQIHNNNNDNNNNNNTRI